MTRKKTEQAEQTTIVPETEAAQAGNEPVTPGNFTVSEFTETLFDSHDPLAATGFSLEYATEESGETPPNEADGLPEDEPNIVRFDGQDAALPDYYAGELDETRDFTVDGDLSDPLDTERRLEEELADLGRESVDGGESLSQEGELQSAQPKRTRRKTAKTEPEQRSEPEDSAQPPKSASSGSRSSDPARFYQTDFNHLDRDLTDEERREWNDIYASFRSQSILTGTVAGVDQYEMPMKNDEGQVEPKVLNSLVVIGYRVKVLIPEPTVWAKGEEHKSHVLRGMIGATVDYVIISVDREGGVAVASRAQAMTKRRRASAGERSSIRADAIVPCSVLVVGPKRCLLTCGGYDVPMRPQDMSYASILDMRKTYRPGQELKARVISFDPAQKKLILSVKEATSNPFIGAERRHPVGSRRQAVITGKYGGGVFCALQDGTLCMCKYSNVFYDSEFVLGDSVIVYISQYHYGRQHIYGRIVSKW